MDTVATTTIGVHKASTDGSATLHLCVFIYEHIKLSYTNRRVIACCCLQRPHAYIDTVVNVTTATATA